MEEMKEKIRQAYRTTQYDDIKGNTPLHLAVIRGSTELVQIYIKTGHNVNSKNKNLETPLHLAVIFGNLELIKLLISHGAKADAYCFWKYTPLHLACGMGNSMVVLELLKSAANIVNSTEFFYPYTPLHCTILGWRFIYEALEVLKYLVKDNSDCYSFINCKQTDDINSRLEIVDALLNAGAELNDFTFKDTPLHFSVKNNLITLSKELIVRGARVDVLDRKHKPVIYYAAKNGSPELIGSLLEAGANFNEKFSTDRRYECFCELNRGWCRNCPVLQITTPLQNSICSDNEKAASVLINAGADLRDIRSTVWQRISMNMITPSFFNLLIDSGILRESCVPDVPLIVLNSNHYSTNNDIYASLFDMSIDMNTIFYPVKISRTFVRMFNINWAIKLIVKMESADQFKMDQNLLHRIRNNASYFALYSEYKKELDVLKETKMCSKIKLYDLLVKPQRMLVVYSRNVELIRMLACGICDKFPVYGGIIESRMRFAVERKVLLERCLERFSDVCPIKLPRFVQLEILSYLNLSNLHSLSWT